MMIFFSFIFNPKTMNKKFARLSSKVLSSMYLIQGEEPRILQSQRILYNLEVLSLKALTRTTIAGKSVKIHQQLIEHSDKIFRSFLIQILKMLTDIFQYI